MTSTIPVKDQNNHGAIAARHGYKFQDYVATSLVLDMLTNNSLIGVRCEKVDDIDLVFNDFTEYVQVKSTDGESYWNLTELHKKHGKKTIVQKSLDSDKEPGVTAKFRIITERGIQKSLKHLEIERSLRLKSTERDSLIKSIKGKIKDYQSLNKHDVEYWVDNAMWQVIPSMQDALLLAQKKINIFANSFGIPAFDNEVESIYEKILRVVSEVANASNRIYSEQQKTFKQKEVRDMLKEWLQEVCSQRTAYKKTYNSKKELVLSSLSQLQSEDSKRFSHGYCLEYARNKFRNEKLAENIFEWMPEFLLSPRELAETESSDCYSVWQKTLDRIKRRPSSISIPILVSEILLHMLMRHDKCSEPISGILYINSGCEIKEFNNAHIIHSEKDDELWLGSSFISVDNDINLITQNFADFLYRNLDPDVFDISKSRIFEAKKDEHLLPHTIDELLERKSTLSSYIDRYKFVSLFIYNSEKLKDGFTDSYKESLKDEFSAIFNMYCQKINEINDSEINKVCISAYLLPLESFDALISKFNEGISNV
ncbi:MAG: dsDNA nuclease domain-containing protein [Pseudomonadota bacterium]